MSNYIDELKNKVNECHFVVEDDYGSSHGNTEEIHFAIAHINSLGENARRMLEIGILQDTLGLKCRFNNMLQLYKDNNNVHKYFSINFYMDKVVISEYYGKHLFSSEYNSPTWQQDVLTKVKELRNE